MRKIVLMVGAMLALTAGAALATGGSIGLRWTACLGASTPTPLTNRNPACTVNTGQALLVTSFKNPVEAAAGVDGVEAIIDYQTEDGVANNCWWNFTGASRVSELSVVPFDPGDVNGIPVWGCDAYFLTHGGASGGGGMGLLGNGNGRIAAAVGVATGTGTAPSANTNSAVGVTIKNGNTLSCAGCLKKACLTLNRLVFQIKAGPRVEVNAPTVAGGNVVTQQGGFAGCDAVTPTRKATWGSVKALYR